MRNPAVRIPILLSAGLVAGACSDSTGPDTMRPLAVRFSVAEPPGGGSGSGSPTGLVLTDAFNNTLVITEVKMTLEDIDLEDSDQSAEIEGPILVRLALTGNRLTSPVPTAVPPGTYSVISFDISVPDGGDPEEVEYLRVNPDMRDVSIRINGTYNGQPFSFALDLSGDQEIELVPPLVVTETSVGLDVVVEFDLDEWFRRPGGSLMDPRLICSPDDDSTPPGCSPTDRTLVEQNIERSIQSYSDR
jgi:hypothetical protein